jgi:hypothetical protein
VLRHRGSGLVNPGTAFGAGHGDDPPGFVVDNVYVMHDASTGGRRLSAQQRLSLGRTLLLFVRAPDLGVITRVTFDQDLGLAVLRVVADLARGRDG